MKYLIYTCFALLLFSCAPRRTVSRVEVLHKERWFADELTGTHDTVLVMPIAYRGRFMPNPTPKDILTPLKLPSNLNFTFFEYKDFKGALEKELDTHIVRSWEDALLDGDLTKSGEYGAIFSSRGIRFAQVLTMNSISKVRSEKLIERRQLELEGEVWDLLKNRSVWKAKVKVRSYDKGSSDHEIIMKALKELYAELPTCYFPNKNSSF